DKKGLWDLVRDVEQKAGVIDVLVNNAGVSQAVPLALMEEEDWDGVMDVTCKGAFLATQAVLRGMVRLKRGRIVNIGSLAGVKMIAAPVHYCTAKAALKGFTESVAKEVARYGITVNCLAPGVLDDGVAHHIPPHRLEEYLQHCALGRPGKVEEAAEVVAFLASERNSYMSGATIVLDGAV
ncbi:MAG: SDR family oxidoreductase, partial [Deltaproteobacteria bacterium]|nr:SDR family oxidoreductase [Deltaproteobacteria bacterium]